MKKIFTAIAVTVFAFVGTTTTSEARPHGGHGYNQPASKVYVSGYRYGRPVYTQKYFIGYDRCGTPRWGYRTVAAPSHRSCGNNYSNQRYQSRSYDNRRSSGGSVSFRFGR